MYPEIQQSNPVTPEIQGSHFRGVKAYIPGVVIPLDVMRGMHGNANLELWNYTSHDSVKPKGRKDPLFFYSPT